MDDRGNPNNCDLQVPRLSYINNYALIPAHDWLPVSSTTVGTPANVIAFTSRRNLPPADGAQFKGFTGFYPGQPCSGQGGLNTTAYTGLPATYDSTGTLLGLSSHIAGHYTYVTEAFANANANPNNIPAGHYADDGLEMTRTNWTLYGNGTNYAFGDGHAKFQSFGTTVNPNNYEYGEYFYPTGAPALDAMGNAWGGCN